MEGNPIINLINLSVSLIPSNNIQNDDELLDNYEIRDIPTKKEFINSLKTITVNDMTSGLKCCICQEEFKINDIIIKLPCNDKPHYFHKGNTNDCDGILPWLEKNNTCPICRTEFPSETEGNQTEGNQTEGNHIEIDETQNNENIDILQNLLNIPITNNTNEGGLNIYNIVNNVQESIEFELAIQRSLQEQ